jgi:membrane associated rhomboid family serine protease
VFIPIGTTAPRSGVPWLVFSLIAACTLVFLYQLSLGDRSAVRFIYEFALVPLRFANPRWAVAHGLDPNDYLSLVTMAFLHGGWLHIVINMWTLWLFGRAVESRMGRLRFAVLYFSCALLASGAQLVAYPGSPTPTLGASGAIAGVLGAHAMLYPKARIVILLPIVFVPFFFRLSAMVYVAVWFGLQVFQGTGAILSPGMGHGVAWWAHIGGFLAGVALVRFFTPPEPPAPLPAEREPEARGPPPQPADPLRPPE